MAFDGLTRRHFFYGTLLAGAILTETIFSWPGIGKWLVEAIHRRDYPAVQGGILLSVHADDSQWAKRGREVLNETGAEDISSTSEAKGDFANSDRPKALP